jgi:hypothetical protein
MPGNAGGRVYAPARMTALTLGGASLTRMRPRDERRGAELLVCAIHVQAAIGRRGTGEPEGLIELSLRRRRNLAASINQTTVWNRTWVAFASDSAGIAATAA